MSIESVIKNVTLLLNSCFYELLLKSCDKKLLPFVMCDKIILYYAS